MAGFGSARTTRAGRIENVSTSPKQNVGAPWPAFVVLAGAFLVAVPIIRRVVARHALNAGLDLLPVVAVLSLLKVFIFVGARPKSRAGRISFFVSCLPLTGLLVAAVAERCCPGGHPPIAGLVWLMTGGVTALVVVVELVLLANATHRQESKLFLGAEMAYLTACVPVALALLPSFLF